MNFWDNLMSTDEGAATYMESYGEGPGYVTRHTVGSFINDDESVLDVGCGPGWNADHFFKYGPRVWGYLGLDYSERFVRVANKRWKDNAGVFIGNLERTYPLFQIGDARELKQPDESWDVVILQDCLEHTNGYEKPVKEALRVAKKRAIVSFWHLTEDDDHINEDGDDGWGAWYSQPKWEQFLNTLGYVWYHSDIHPEGKTHKWDFYVIDKKDE